MNRIWTFLLDTRVLAVIGIASLAIFLFLGFDVLKQTYIWVLIGLGVIGLIALIIWGVKKWKAHKAGKALENAIESEGNKAAQHASAAKKEEVLALKGRMQDAIKTIKTSKLGQLGGAAALYELPWYIVIGNPAAGKSTAVVNSGLKFPFADDKGSVIQGIGGTRNCDWFFTNEGILLDTAGRYAVHEEDLSEWLGFVDLLKKNRPKAPINGVVITVAISDLMNARPEEAITLAKNLRQRVQEMTERLEVFAPVYVMFTKADLISGFLEFFDGYDPSEREKVWGATLPYNKDGRVDAVASFDDRFDELVAGLKEISVAQMSLHRGDNLPPGLLTFPIEFAGLKKTLRSFLATLFEENPFQYQPIFRGFYFTSASQSGKASSRADQRVAQFFGLSKTSGANQDESIHTGAYQGFFLKELFSKVIFADKGLVLQYSSPAKQRWRALGFGLMALALATALGAWTWSYMSNRQMLEGVIADADKVVKLQADNVDLVRRLEGLAILQDRIEQLARFRESRPLSVSMGLYQGNEVEKHLRQQYFEGVKSVMLEPVAQSIESYLGEVNNNPKRLQPISPNGQSSGSSVTAVSKGTRYVDASTESAADAYNALKTYLMLSKEGRENVDSGHLADQITRFWRGWLDDNRGNTPREEILRHAERIISFTTNNVTDPDFPLLETRYALIDSTRGNLRELIRGMPGVERVYSNIKARAATRFPPITVAGLIRPEDKGILEGSYAVPGQFTHEAWEGYIEQAIKEASTTELQNKDWVLATTSSDDLTLAGSPEQIRKTLTEMYKNEYVKEWQRFMQGISITSFSSFEEAVTRMNSLGDPQLSPVKKVMTTLFDQTSWDNPSLLNARLAKTQKGFMDWFKSTILRMAPSKVEVDVKLSADQAGIPLGPIGKEFASLTRLMMAADGAQDTPMTVYLKNLSKVRSQFNAIKNAGDPGPGAKELLSKTVDGSGSVLVEALKHVDEQMLVQMSDSSKAAIRPILVRPLIESLAVVVNPAEREMNRVWDAQVRQPFDKSLANKYPFDPNSKMEAANSDITAIFGPDGAISKFASQTLGPTVNRRGDVFEPRTWGDVGIHLRPQFTQGIATWLAPVQGAANTGGGTGTAGTGGNLTADQTLFQVLPLGAPGLSEYTLTIDGQVLRYRNGAAEWTNMVWPNPAGAPGARLTATTLDGRVIDLVNEAGSSGLQRLIGSAEKVKMTEGSRLTWKVDNAVVSVQLKVVRAPGATQASDSGSGSQASATPVIGLAKYSGLKLPALVVGTDASETTAGATNSAGAMAGAGASK